MKTLPPSFQSNGFTMTQVMRDGDLAIYRRMKQIEGRTIEHSEVVIIRVSPEEFVFGKHYPERETYPSSEQWGTHGFTCPDLDSAWERVRKILKEREERASNTATGSRSACKQ